MNRILLAKGSSISISSPISNHYQRKSIISSFSSLTSTNKMKFRHSQICTAALLAAGSSTTSAWVPQHIHRQGGNVVGRPKIQQQSQQQQQQRQYGSSSLLHYSTTTTSLQSTPVADDIVEETHIEEEQNRQPKPQEERKGKPIAKGSIVSSYQGGLVAVRVDDDLTNDQEEEVVLEPEVIDTTKSLPESTTKINLQEEKSIKYTWYVSLLLLLYI